MAIDDNTSYELTGYQVKDLASKIRAKADSNSLASVATSGLYSDLTGAPTIPTVYNGTLTIQQNGTQLGTFSANQSSNTTINITGGGSAPSVTTYYIGTSFETLQSTDDVAFYKEESLTTVVTPQEFNDAMINGMVFVVNVSSGITAYYSIAFGDDSATSVSGMPDIADYCFIGAAWGGSSPSIFHFTNTTTPNKTVTYSYYYSLQHKLTAGSNVSISSNNTISATDTTYSAMTGATSGAAGTSGLVPAPAIGDQDKVLKGDGTWGTAQAQLVEMSYGESNAWAKFLAAYQAKSIVYCGASSNANPATGAKTRRAFMAYVNNETSPTEVEFQYVRSVGTKTSSQPVDQVFVYKLTSTNGGTWSVQTRDMAPKVAAGTGASVSYGSGTYTVGMSTMTGAASGTAGTGGAVPAPAAGDNTKFLRGDGTWQTLMNAFYPVGSIYMSATLATAADVEAALGGTWTAWGAGRVPVGVDTSDTDFDTAEETGGEKAHTLVVNELPSHTHNIGGSASYVSGSPYIQAANNGSANFFASQSTGEDKAHNNLQPYITCYMYKRTA